MVNMSIVVSINQISTSTSESPKKFKLVTNDSNIKALVKSLEEKTGLKTKIHHKKNNKGTLSFEYDNADQLDRIVMVIKANY